MMLICVCIRVCLRVREGVYVSVTVPVCVHASVFTMYVHARLFVCVGLCFDVHVYAKMCVCGGDGLCVC